MGIIFRSWEVIAAVVALKTVARYQELNKKAAAEYFLIGSLASILWAIAVTAALVIYDHIGGFYLIPRIFLMVR